MYSQLVPQSNAYYFNAALQNQLVSQNRANMLYRLVDDRRRDWEQDLAIRKLLFSLKYQDPNDALITSLAAGQSVPASVAMNSIIADRVKDTHIADLIERVIQDRRFNRHTNQIIAETVHGGAGYTSPLDAIQNNQFDAELQREAHLLSVAGQRNPQMLQANMMYNNPYLAMSRYAMF